MKRTGQNFLRSGGAQQYAPKHQYRRRVETANLEEFQQSLGISMYYTHIIYSAEKPAGHFHVIKNLNNEINSCMKM